MTKPVWISSYPRSGNTLLRTILWQCFGYRSGSFYLNDLAGNKELEEYVGHIERGPNNTLRFPDNAIPFIKTHNLANDDSPAIYVIRDGRAACVSLWKFYNKKIPLVEIIDGKNHKFGTWESHVNSWDPWNRPNTLLLKYEEMTADISATLKILSAYLNSDILRDNIPDRSNIAQVGGQHVNASSDWSTTLSGTLLDRFMQINESTLKKAGYFD